jgi:hypothetical protein
VQHEVKERGRAAGGDHIAVVDDHPVNSDPVLGRPVKFRRLPMPVVRLGLGKEFFQMFRWFNESGYQADVEGLRARYPELGLQTLEDWLREEGWENRRTITVKRDKIGRPLTHL